MLINEIFKSIDGESLRAGQIATFVRTVGCNLRCAFCDSKYTWGAEPTNRKMTPDDIVKECQSLGAHNITFTGGEPLIQPDADELINKLADAGFEVSIETDGAVDFTERDWFVNNKENVWVCADYKCGASGMTNNMLPLEKFAKLRPQDVLKFVVGGTDDLDMMKIIITRLRFAGCDCHIFVSPVFGMIEPKTIVEYLINNDLQYKVHFQIQLHKIVWDPNLRGV